MPNGILERKLWSGQPSEKFQQQMKLVTRETLSTPDAYEVYEGRYYMLDVTVQEVKDVWGRALAAVKDSEGNRI